MEKVKTIKALETILDNMGEILKKPRSLLNELLFLLNKASYLQCMTARALEIAFGGNSITFEQQFYYSSKLGELGKLYKKWNS